MPPGLGQLVPEDMGKVIFAEGRVVGDLEAIVLAAPGLAEQAKLSTSDLIAGLTD